MKRNECRWAAPACCLALLVNGCASIIQPRDVVLIREPGQRRYSPPAPASASAATLWPYAVLSANVYHGVWHDAPVDAASVSSGASSKPAADALSPPSAAPGASAAPAAYAASAAAAGVAEGGAVDPYVKACVGDPQQFLPVQDWKSWPQFPSASLRTAAEGLGLYLEVWENRSMSPPVVAVVFRGTEFRSWLDWESNLRWFARFIPKHEDQYTLVSSRLGDEFVEESARRALAMDAAGSAGVRVVSAGHSLGGGLAQHFAYSLPLKSKSGVETPRVDHVYAFDPSPVTGWFSVPADIREKNARRLVIDRVFEHGEILAYLRLVLSYAMPPSAERPAIREIRFNFRTGDAFANHSMTRLACDLALARHSSPAAATVPATTPRP